MLNIAMIAILNRRHEFRAHLKGALTNGVTREEIREILMQVEIKRRHAGCGVDSFRIAREVFAEIDGRREATSLHRRPGEGRDP